MSEETIHFRVTLDNFENGQLILYKFFSASNPLLIKIIVHKRGFKSRRYI